MADENEIQVETEDGIVAPKNEVPGEEEKPNELEAGEAAKETPGEEEKETPGPTPFENLIAATEDPEQRVAMIQRAIDGLPEDQREKLPALQAQLSTAESARQQGELQAREDARRGQIKSHEDKSGTAYQRLKAHLTETLSKMRTQAKDIDNVDPDVSPDDALVDQTINEIVDAQVFLRNQDTRQLFSEAVISRIHGLGDSIETARLQEMAKQADSDEGQQRHGMVGAYLDELISRAKQAGYADGLKEGDVRLERFKTSELGAYINEQMREEGMEPNTDKGTKKGSKKTFEQLKKMTREEMAAMPREERDRALAAS